MKICEYRYINHVDDDSSSWDYLEIGWCNSPFEVSEIMYHKGNGYSFSKDDEELIEWYDVNLII